VSATDRSFIQKSPTECDGCASVVSKSQQWGVLSPLGLSSHGKYTISLTFRTHVIRSWHIGLPPPPSATATKSIFRQVQYAIYLLIRLLSEELTVLVIFKLVSKRQEIWHFNLWDYEVLCLLGYDAVLPGRSIPTFQRNLLSSLLGHVTVLEMAWRFGKLPHLVIVVVEAADSPETTTHACQSTRRHVPEHSSLHCPSCHFCLTCCVSFLLLPFPIRRSSFCVCSMLLPAVDRWRKLLSFSCFIPSPRQKKTYPHHTCSYSRSLPGFIRKFQSCWNVSLPASIARASSLALLSYVQRGKLIRNGALGWGPYCLVIFMYVLSEHILAV